MRQFWETVGGFSSTGRTTIEIDFYENNQTEFFVTVEHFFQAISFEFKWNTYYYFNMSLILKAFNALDQFHYRTKRA